MNLKKKADVSTACVVTAKVFGKDAWSKKAYRQANVRMIDVEKVIPDWPPRRLATGRGRSVICLVAWS